MKVPTLEIQTYFLSKSFKNCINVKKLVLLFQLNSLIHRFISFFIHCFLFLLFTYLFNFYLLILTFCFIHMCVCKIGNNYKIFDAFDKTMLTNVYFTNIYIYFSWQFSKIMEWTVLQLVKTVTILSGKMLLSKFISDILALSLIILFGTQYFSFFRKGRKIYKVYEIHNCVNEWIMYSNLRFLHYSHLLIPIIVISCVFKIFIICFFFFPFFNRMNVLTLKT